MLSAFPCGRTQHVRRMRSSIVSMTQSVLEFRFMRAIPVMFQVMSVLPFSAKNAFVKAYLLESCPSSVKRCRVLFLNYFMFAKV